MKATTCEMIREELSDYLDGRMNLEDVKAMEEHLKNCESCRKEVEELREIIALLHDMPMTPVPARFDSDFSRRLKRETSQNTTVWRKKTAWKTLSALAAVLMVAFLSTAMLQDGISFNLKDLSPHEESVQDSGADNMEMNSSGLSPDEEAESCDSASSSTSAETGGTVPESEIQKKTGFFSSLNDSLTGGLVSNMCVYDSVPVGDQSGGTDSDLRSAPQAQEESRSFAEDSSASQTESTAATDVGISRGGGSFSQENYEKDCETWLLQYIEGIQSKDPSLFADTVEMGGINGYTTDMARIVLNLYEDYFGDAALTCKRVRISPERMESSYAIEGQGRQIRVNMKATASGLKVSEVLLDCGPWLSQQLSGEDFFLEGYEIRNGGEEILFLVQTREEGTADEGEQDSEKQQVKEIIWKKTE